MAVRLDHQHAVLILVVDAQAAHPRRQLPPLPVAHDLDLEALLPDDLGDLRGVMIGQQDLGLARQERERFEVKMIRMTV